MNIKEEIERFRRESAYLKKTLREAGLDPFFAIATALVNKLAETPGCQENRTTGHAFLDLARFNDLLRQIYKEGRQNAWCEVVIEVIRQSNFTVGELFRQRAAAAPAKTLFSAIENGRLNHYAWRYIDNLTSQICSGLRNLDPDPGPVAILSSNSLEMACIDLACLRYGIVDVMLPANAVPETIGYILNHSKAKTLFVENEELHDKVRAEILRLNYLERTITMGSFEGGADSVTFQRFLQLGVEHFGEDFNDHADINSLATVMYTSGTTEAPKGIMFSQLNLVSKRFARAIALPEIGASDVFLSYLPMYHTFGRYFEMLGSVFWGCQYVFMESVQKEVMLENMRLIRPTIFISIPKKWIQLHEEVAERIDIDGPNHDEIRKVTNAVTGGRLKWGLSAAGYLDPDIFRFFQRNGIELMSGFGMTEATGGITMTPPSGYRFDSVGKALPGIAVKLADDGEMLIRGPYVMMGYLHEGTAGFDDGWLVTGDIFTCDEDGYYQIIDRKKEIYKNIRGETISPQKIENLFHDLDAVKRVFVVGDHRAYNTALLYPNFDNEEIVLSKMSERKLREFFSSFIVSVNRFLSPYERIVDFVIIERDFQPDLGELTAKGTYKRKAIEQNFESVISTMYGRDHVSVKFKGYDLQVPTWLLREEGLTPSDILLERHSLHFLPLERKLDLAVRSGKAGRIQIGNICYQVPSRTINLGQLIENAALWMGNFEFEQFVGERIYRWTRVQEGPSEIVPLLAKEPSNVHRAERTKLKTLLAEKKVLRRGIHLATYLLNSLRDDAVELGLQYFELAVTSKNAAHSQLARMVLSRCLLGPKGALNRDAFLLLLKHDDSAWFRALLEQFIHTNSTSIDNDFIASIPECSLSKQQVNNMLETLNRYCIEGNWRNMKLRLNSATTLMSVLTVYGGHHPVSFRSIRGQLLRCALVEFNERMASYGRRCLDLLQRGFRNMLGQNLRIAVNPDTWREFSWSDVVVFEEDVPKQDRQRLSQAIRNRSLIREAIFLFTGGTLIQLQEIPYKGIWISLVEKRPGKNAYRASIQTHHYGSFDITINVNHTLTPEQVQSELDWLISTGIQNETRPLVPEFGGYWAEFDLWTEEYVPVETVKRFLTRLENQIEKRGMDRVQHLWTYLVWTGASAFIDFWNRTGRRFEISEPVPGNVVVPSYDFQVGFRIVSISHLRPFKDVESMLLRLKRHFIDAVENQYGNLKGQAGLEILFACVPEMLGEQEGIEVLRKTLSEMEFRRGRTASDFANRLRLYLNDVRINGFRPMSLHFAIKRFIRWTQINPAATPGARQQTLQEMETTYMLQEIERRFPGVRLQYYRDTIFADCSLDVRNELNMILMGIKGQQIVAEDLPGCLAKVREKFSFSAEEEAVLTRLSYSHLGPGKAAEFISLTTEGSSQTAVVVFVHDSEGNRYAIRHPAHPKEIARLHKMFSNASLPVEFRPEHQFLVMLNEHVQVIGGLFYRQTDPECVHLEKVVVDERYRKKGLSEGLLHEFFNRLISQGVKNVTVGFLRPQYFYRFGFKIDERYGNMVKELDTEASKERKEAEFVESI